MNHEIINLAVDVSLHRILRDQKILHDLHMEAVTPYSVEDIAKILNKKSPKTIHKMHERGEIQLYVNSEGEKFMPKNEFWEWWSKTFKKPAPTLW